MTAIAARIPYRPRVRVGRSRSVLLLASPLLLLAIVAIAAPVLGLQDPNKQDLLHTLQPPAFAGGSWDHPLGTDKLGRDMLSQLVFGSRLTLLIGLVGMLVAVIPGSLLGVVAGFRRGVVDAIVSRLVDAQLALPFVLVAIAIITARGPSLTILFIVIAITGWAHVARIVRAETLSLRQRRFVVALRAAGASNTRIVLRHVLPNLSGTIVVLATLQIGSAILIESALSYLGLGVVPPQISWGEILAGGKDVVQQAWWVATFPGIMITLVVLFVNLLGDALLTYYDPKKRRFS